MASDYEIKMKLAVEPVKGVQGASGSSGTPSSAIVDRPAGATGAQSQDIARRTQVALEQLVKAMVEMNKTLQKGGFTPPPLAESKPGREKVVTPGTEAQKAEPVSQAVQKAQKQAEQQEQRKQERAVQRGTQRANAWEHLQGGNIGGALQGALQSIPVVGALTGIAGFLLTQASRIGNAYIQEAGQQIPTAGIGGYRVRGQGMMAPGEVSAYYQQLRLTSGNLRAGEGGRVGINDSSEQYRRLFGVGAGEMGRTMGLLEMSAPGQSQQVFERIFSNAMKEGQTSQMQVITEYLGSSLEEFAQRGIRISNPEDISASVTAMARYSETGTAAGAIALQRTLGAQTTAVSKGQAPGGAYGYRMYALASRQEYIRKFLGEHPDVASKWGVSEAELAGPMDRTTQMFLAQQIAAAPEAQAELRGEMMGEVAQGVLGGKKLDYYKQHPLQARAKMWAAIKGQPGYEDLTAPQAAMLYGPTLERMGISMPTVQRGDETALVQRRLQGLAGAEGAKRIQISRAERALSPLGAEAARGVEALEKSLNALVTSANMQKVADGIEMIAEKMEKFQKSDTSLLEAGKETVKGWFNW